MKKRSNRTIVRRIKRGKEICPTCGCRYKNTTINTAEWPGRWVIMSCANCHMTTNYIDNCELTSVVDVINQAGARSIKEMRKIHREFYNNKNSL